MLAASTLVPSIRLWSMALSVRFPKAPSGEIEGGVTPGSGYPFFDTRFGKVGMMIRHDGFFPEVARELNAHADSDFIAGQTPAVGRWKTLAQNQHEYGAPGTRETSSSVKLKHPLPVALGNRNHSAVPFRLNKRAVENLVGRQVDRLPVDFRYVVMVGVENKLIPV